MTSVHGGTALQESTQNTHLPPIPKLGSLDRWAEYSSISRGCSKKTWNGSSVHQSEDFPISINNKTQNRLSFTDSNNFHEDVACLVALLKACAQKKDLSRGAKLHAAILTNESLAKDIFVCTGLINMYAKCGALAKSKEVFDKVLTRNVTCWNALIAGYAKNGQGHEALECFEKMQDEGLSPNAVTFTCALKACGNVGALKKGKEIHDQVIRRGLLRKDLILGNSLVDMYSKCGELVKAQQVFDMLPVRDAISWNALITGYVQNGHSSEVFDCFERMKEDGFLVDAVTYIFVLKACGSLGTVNKGEQIHSEVVKRGMLAKDVHVGNALMDMYVKCGAFSKAQELFEELPIRTVASWNVLIAGYAQQGQANEALNCFECMQKEGISPSVISFSCIYKACIAIGATDKLEGLHAQVARDGLLDKDTMLGNALMDMYVKCGALARAQEVLDELSIQNVVSWNTLIAGYMQHGYGSEALDCFEEMRTRGFSPNAVTFSSLLKACGQLGAIDKGSQIHAEVVTQRLLEKDDILGVTLVDMYAKCGALVQAQEVFDELPIRDVVTWCAIIGGYILHGDGNEALSCFKHMQLEGIVPNSVIFTCILNACGSCKAVENGIEIHLEVSRRGLLKKDVLLSIAVLDMYIKCGALARAQEVFDEFSIRDTTLWNVLFSGYIQHGQDNVALECFEQMRNEGLLADIVTFTCILQACGSLQAAEMGKRIHDDVAKQDLLRKDVMLGNALVDMYGKCGAVAKAQEVFNELPARDVVSWTALIAVYIQHDCGAEALSCFEHMQEEGLFPNEVTFVCILEACGDEGALEKGIEIHVESLKQGLLKNDNMLETALVDMYAKCGFLVKSQEIFDELSAPNIITWNVLIAGYAHHGHGDEAMRSFEQMQNDALYPNDITFSILISACSHSGFLDDGQMYFLVMSCYDIIPTFEHHTCMMDLFCRAGELKKVFEIAEETLSHDSLPVWFTILGACQKWGNAKLGSLVYEHIIQIGGQDSSAYICMSNIYVADGMSEEKDKLEAIRVNNKLQK